jgi:hypothetical protein
MDLKIYHKKNTPKWDDFVAEKFAGFLFKAYKGKEIPPDKDKHWIAHETIDSDVIICLEDKDSVIGFTSVKFIGKMLGYKKPIYIREIAVRIEDREKGISRDLRSQMLKELNPDLILGVAHNPISVISRANFFDNRGFQTYWGNLPVGEYINVKDGQSLDTIGKDFVSKEFPSLLEKYQNGVLPYVDANIWAEGTSTENKNVAKVLGKILDFQKLNKIPAMATLISLKITKDD